MYIRETRFAIHFNNFEEHFFLVFVKFAHQSLIAKLSFNLVLNINNIVQLINEVTLVLVKNKIHYIYSITVTFAVMTHRVIISVSATFVITSDL